MTTLDDAETCPDCGRPFGTEAEFDSAERVVCGMGPEMRSSTYHYDGFAIGLRRVGTIERLRSRIAELEAALGRAEAIVAAGDRLCVAAVRCGIHTWSSIPPEGIHRALQFGCRMHEYINASPTFEWPFDDDAANVTAKEARALAKGDRATKGKVKP